MVHDVEGIAESGGAMFALVHSHNKYEHHRKVRDGGHVALPFK